MFWFKSCPRCRGDLAQHEDIYGRYVFCLQCGYQLTPQQEENLLIWGLLPAQEEVLVAGV